MTDLLPAILLMALTLALGALGIWISPTAARRSQRTYDDGWWDGFWMGQLLDDDECDQP